MDYISEIFSRTSVQQIREFLFHGVENVEVSDKPYKERIDKAGKEVFEAIRNKFSDREEYEKMANLVHKYSGELQDAYMEIGMRCGAIITAKLLTPPQ